MSNVLPVVENQPSGRLIDPFDPLVKVRSLCVYSCLHRVDSFYLDRVD